MTHQERIKHAGMGAGLLALAAACWWVEPSLGRVGPISLGGVAILASLPLAFYGVAHLWSVLTPKEVQLTVPTAPEERETQARFRVRWNYENALREAMGCPRLECLAADGPWGEKDIQLRKLSQEWAEEAIRGGLHALPLPDIQARAREDVAARIRARRKAEFERVSLGCCLIDGRIVCGTGETWEQHEEFMKHLATMSLESDAEFEARVARERADAERASHESIRRKRLEAGIPLEEYEHEFWNEPGWHPAAKKERP